LRPVSRIGRSIVSMLREREPALTTLDRCLTDAAGGEGRLVLLAGEAGVGKTSVVREFCRQQRSGAEVLWGACDALGTPTPLGPLYDMARESMELATLLAAEVNQYERFGGFLAAITDRARTGRPVVVVIEDVHWADQTTLDLLVFLGRRILASRALVLVTYRDDGMGPEHPLRAVLGRLTEPHVRRLALSCLSPEAVADMVAGRPLDPASVYQVTGGNPFFVTELLAAPPATVPQTVRDAVLARVAQLSPVTRSVLEVVAVVPDRIELSVLLQVAGDAATAAVRESEQAGVVRLDTHTVGFRHELARQAVEQAIPAAALPGLHARVLAHLAGEPEPDPARLSYHAGGAGDPAAVLRYAPTAAANASRLGAHRQAIAHYRQALRYAERLTDAEHATLLEKYATECSATGLQSEGGEALGQAVALWRRFGDVDALASAMVRHAHFLYMTASAKETFAQVDEAIALVEGRNASPAMAEVHAYGAFLYSLNLDRERTLLTGNRAVALAEEFGDHLLLSIALVALGGVQWWTNPDEAEATLVRAVEAAHRSGRAAGVVTAAGSLGATALGARRYRTADHWLAEVVDWCIRHDLDAPRDFYRSCLTSSHFWQGRWREAADLAEALTAPDAGTYPPARLNARRVAGHLAVRRGDPDQTGPLAEVWEQTATTGDPIRQWPVVAARAESAWHAGRAAEITDIVRDTYLGVLAKGHPWATGELAFWLWRGGGLDQPPEGTPDPYGLHITGDYLAAADAWDAIGCPYEAADARADSGDPEQMRAALETFYQLGARPAANRLVRGLRKLGVTDLPRRPYRSTGTNPAGLTDRELEVTALLAGGMSDGDIAARLHISRRTVGHHVGAVLLKLEVSGRREVADAARRLGIRAADG
jgi:DNA-binding CsgD family transcriptional regulator/tetratricopeptide (TPR) repeat protein